MKERRIRLHVDVALDGIYGAFDNPDDFIKLLTRAVPPWYLRGVTYTDLGDAERPREDER